MYIIYIYIYIFVHVHVHAYAFMNMYANSIPHVFSSFHMCMHLFLCIYSATLKSSGSSSIVGIHIVRVRG